MKRNPNQITVKKIYPLIFWQDCDICKMQFRREFGFQTSSTVKGHLSMPFIIQREYCGGCAPDKAAAENIFKQFLIDREGTIKPPVSRSERPAPPPPPPPRVSKTSM